MAGFREPDFKERQKAAARAQQAELNKFRATAADPAVAERQQSRAADVADRRAAKQIRAAEKAEQKARAAEAAMQAARDAAIAAEIATAEKTKRELAKLAEQKAARDARYASRKARSKKGTR
jgi:hypothetical protein